jgi:hypothetical protein
MKFLKIIRPTLYWVSFATSIIGLFVSGLYFILYCDGVLAKLIVDVWEIGAPQDGGLFQPLMIFIVSLILLLFVDIGTKTTDGFAKK